MRKFGFVKVRGSKSRGAVRALLGMRRELEQGGQSSSTIDGPRGPRYVAKPLRRHVPWDTDGGIPSQSRRAWNLKYVGPINDWKALRER